MARMNTSREDFIYDYVDRANKFLVYTDGKIKQHAHGKKKSLKH